MALPCPTGPQQNYIFSHVEVVADGGALHAGLAHKTLPHGMILFVLMIGWRLEPGDGRSPGPIVSSLSLTLVAACAPDSGEDWLEGSKMNLC